MLLENFKFWSLSIHDKYWSAATMRLQPEATAVTNYALT